MRILLVSSLYPPDQVGGAEVLVAQLASDLARSGDTVAVAALSREASDPREEAGVRVYSLGHGPVFYPLDWAGRSAGERAAYKVATQIGTGVLPVLKQVIQDFRPDIVNTHSLSELSPRVWSVAAKLGVPIVHTLHDFSGLCTNGAMFKDGRACQKPHGKCRLYGALHRLQSRHVDAVVGVGQDILARHLAAGHFDRTTADCQGVIWNAVEPAAKAIAPADGMVTFGFLGRIEPSKGVDLLIDACRQLPPTGWRLKIAGRAIDGEARYRETAAGLPIQFMGFVDRDAFLASIDCLIAPPLWAEPFGRTVAEAYLRGLPVIGADIAGVSEQVRLVDPAWVFRVGDANALADRMQAFLDAPNAATPTEAALTRFAGRVDPTAIVSQYRAMFAKLL